MLLILGLDFGINIEDVKKNIFLFYSWRNIFRGLYVIEYFGGCINKLNIWCKFYFKISFVF